MSQPDRIKLEAERSPHFIGAWRLPEPAVCDGLIEFFEANPGRHQAGAVGSGVDPEAKRSTDLVVNPRELEEDPALGVFNDYMNQLRACYRDYRDQWPFLAGFLDEVHIGTFNVQRYDAGGHFAKVHSERTSLATLHRILVWMTYLNDVSTGGETVFDHYRLAVTPERGKTLIWPAEWTHAHSGQPVPEGTKYIITGWMHFPDQPSATAP